MWFLSHNLIHTNDGMKRWFIESGMFIFIILYIDLNCIFGLDSNSDIFGDFLGEFFLFYFSFVKKDDSKWSMFIEKLIPFTRQTKFVPVISLQYVLSFLTHFENLIFCFSFITSPDKHIWRSLQNASLDSLSFCRLWNQHEVFLRNDGGGFNDAPICNELCNQKYRFRWIRC